MNGDGYQKLIEIIFPYIFLERLKIPKHTIFGIGLQALKPEFGVVIVYTRFMIINPSGKSRMIFSVRAKFFQVSAKKWIIGPFLNWDSLHARLSSHSEARSYKKKKHKKIKSYRNFFKKTTYNLVKRYLLILDLNPHKS